MNVLDLEQQDIELQLQEIQLMVLFQRLRH